MLKSHSWKSLRKFNSVKKLAEARIFKEYPHLQRNFSRNDSIDRPNPKIPPLEKIEEVLFVNPAEQIRPDTLSDTDSHTLKKEDDPLDDSDLDLLQAPLDIEELQSPASAEGSTSGDQSSSGEERPHAPRVAADA